MVNIEFICDYCGSVVGLHDDKCSHCGVVFAAVKCPKCDYHGTLDNFANGCPKCKYNHPTKLKPRIFINPWIVFVMLLALSIFSMLLVLTNHI